MLMHIRYRHIYIHIIDEFDGEESLVIRVSHDDGVLQKLFVFGWTIFTI